MDLNFFADPGLAPKPRDQIRIESFHLRPYDDARRVRVDVEITPFAPSDRPNLEIAAFTEDETPVASVSIVEATQRMITLTMHLRGPVEPHAPLTFHAALYYGEEPPQHTLSHTITLSDSQAGDAINADIS